MKIECRIPRPKGTKVTFGGTVYHFKPEFPGGPHVADVADKNHAARLLEIPEGYRAVAETVAPKPEVPDTPAGAHVLQGDGDAGEAGGSDGLPAEPRSESAEAPKRRPGRPKKAS